MKFIKIQAFFCHSPQKQPAQFTNLWEDIELLDLKNSSEVISEVDGD